MYYKISIFEDSPKGAFSREVASLSSSNLKQCFTFLQFNELKLGSDYTSNLIDAYNDVLGFNYNSDDEDIDKVKFIVEKEISNNTSLCLRVLETLSLYNIGIQFSVIYK